MVTVPATRLPPDHPPGVNATPTIPGLTTLDGN